MEVKWIEYKGKKILYVEYRGAQNEDEMLKILHEFAGILRESKDKILSIGDFTDTFASDGFMKELKKLGKEILNAKTEKGALLGISGIKKIFYRAYLRFTGVTNLALFETVDQANEWLIK